MKRRYVLAPEAARDLAEIWKHINKESGRTTADRIESVTEPGPPEPAIP